MRWWTWPIVAAFALPALVLVVIPFLVNAWRRWRYLQGLPLNRAWREAGGNRRRRR